MTVSYTHSPPLSLSRFSWFNDWDLIILSVHSEPYLDFCGAWGFIRVPRSGDIGIPCNQFSCILFYFWFLAVVNSIGLGFEIENDCFQPHTLEGHTNTRRYCWQDLSLKCLVAPSLPLEYKINSPRKLFLASSISHFLITRKQKGKGTSYLIFPLII